MKSECDIKHRISFLEKGIKDYTEIIHDKEYMKYLKKEDKHLYNDTLRIIPRYREEIQILKWVLRED